MKIDAPRAYRRCLLAYAMVLAVLLAASFLTSWRLWGFSWYGYFSWYGPGILLLAGIMVPVVLSRQPSLLRQTAEKEAGKRTGYGSSVAALVICFGAAFVFFAAQTHFLGDGYQLLTRLETGGVPIRPWNPGIYFIQDTLFALLGGAGPETAKLTFRLISWGCGLLLVLAGAVTGARLFPTRRDRLLFVLGLATGGYALLFFGYVENYPLFVLAVGWFALAGLTTARGRLNKYWLLAPMALGALVHPYSIVMIPGGLYLILRDTRFGHSLDSMGRPLKRTFWGMAILVLVVSVLSARANSYFLRFALVPLVEDQFTVEGYTLFSLSHLTDMLNLWFILAPALPLYLVMFATKSTRGVFRRPEYKFLLMILLPSLALSFLFDPKLGMPRDWDMHAFAGIPLVLLTIYTLLDRRNLIPGYLPMTVLVIAINGLVLAPRVLIPVIPDHSVAWFDNISNLDILKSSSGRFLLGQYLDESGHSAEADRRRSENSRLFPHQLLIVEGRDLMQAGQLDRAAANFRQAIRMAPSYSYAWCNLGIVHIQKSQYDSALTCLEIADGLNPYNADTYDALGQVYLFKGDLDRGEQYSLDAARLDQENFTARGNLLRLYQRQKRQEDYERILLEMAWLREVPLEYVTQAAGLYLMRGEFEPASRAFLRAVSLGLDSMVVYRLQDQYPELKVLY